VMVGRPELVLLGDQGVDLLVNRVVVHLLI
jgi:hypothetical protein